jgi:hypothetical protein
VTVGDLPIRPEPAIDPETALRRLREHTRRALQEELTGLIPWEELKAWLLSVQGPGPVRNLERFIHTRGSRMGVAVIRDSKNHLGYTRFRWITRSGTLLCNDIRAWIERYRGEMTVEAPEKTSLPLLDLVLTRFAHYIPFLRIASQALRLGLAVPTRLAPLSLNELLALPLVVRLSVSRPLHCLLAVLKSPMSGISEAYLLTPVGPFLLTLFPAHAQDPLYALEWLALWAGITPGRLNNLGEACWEQVAPILVPALTKQMLDLMETP